jgi:hypothetical protein
VGLNLNGKWRGKNVDKARSSHEFVLSCSAFSNLKATLNFLTRAIRDEHERVTRRTNTTTNITNIFSSTRSTTSSQPQEMMQNSGKTTASASSLGNTGRCWHRKLVPPQVRIEVLLEVAASVSHNNERACTNFHVSLEAFMQRPTHAVTYVKLVLRF